MPQGSQAEGVGVAGSAEIVSPGFGSAVPLTFPQGASGNSFFGLWSGTGTLSSGSPAFSAGTSGDTKGADFEKRLRDLEKSVNILETRQSGSKETSERHDRSLEDLMAKIEDIKTSVKEIQEDRASMLARVDAAEGTLKTVATQAISRTPTWWQIPAAVTATGAGLVSLFAFLRWLQKAGFIN